MSNERQKTMNKEQYERYLSCGYTGEMTVNECGWCDNEVAEEDRERIDLFDQNRCYAYIRFAHLPNGKWIASSSMSMPTYGYGCPLSVWCNQHETREDAIETELKRVETSIEPKDLKPFIVDAIKKCRNALRPLEIALF